LRREINKYEEFTGKVKRIVPVGTKGKTSSLRVASLPDKILQGRETD